MKRHSLAGYLAAALFAAALCLFISCTVKEEKHEPGPLKVWLMKDPEAEVQIKSMVAEFESKKDFEVELEFKDTYDINSALIEGEAAEAGVDVVEVDIFDMAGLSEHMQDASGVLLEIESTESFYNAPVLAGKFEGEQRFIPFRLSWPALVSRADVRGRFRTWDHLSGAAMGAEQVGVPALDDRELCVLVCSLIYANNGDPGDPGSPGFGSAFSWLEQISGRVLIGSGAAKSGDMGSWPEDEMPGVFFEWPEGLAAMEISGLLAYDFEVHPFPCADTRSCAVVFLGRYLGVPEKARHEKDAFSFIRYMVSSSAQRRLLFTSPWLPVRSDGWGDMGARKVAYRALRHSANNLKRPPRRIKELTGPLSNAARDVLFFGKGADTALKEYKTALEH